MRFLAPLLLCAFSTFSAPSIPISFEPNRGQAAAGIDFVGHFSGYTLMLRGGNAEFRSRGGRVSADLAGAHPSKPEPEETLPGVVTYLVGYESDWRRNIPTYGRVRYRDVYPGIDLVYYGRQGALEYDFLVAPGADPRRIHIDFRGARQLSLDPAGDLVIDTAAGPMRQRRPDVYQEIAGVRRRVPARYRVRGNSASFEIGRYDRTRSLIIDPTLTWAVFAGTTVTDEARAVTGDSSGNVYVTGSALSTRGDTDAFVVKLDSTGKLLSRTLIGWTDGDDDSYGIAVDSAGAIYVVGQTTSIRWPISVTYAGLGSDGFYAKIDPTAANYVYAGYFGGEDEDVIFACALDANNNLWFGGATLSTKLPVTRGAPSRISPPASTASSPEWTAAAPCNTRPMWEAPRTTTSTAWHWILRGTSTSRARPTRATCRSLRERSNRRSAVGWMPSLPGTRRAEVSPGSRTWAEAATTRPTGSRWTPRARR